MVRGVDGLALESRLGLVRHLDPSCLCWTAKSACMSIGTSELGCPRPLRLPVPVSTTNSTRFRQRSSSLRFLSTGSETLPGLKRGLAAAHDGSGTRWLAATRDRRCQANEASPEAYGCSPLPASTGRRDDVPEFEGSSGSALKEEVSFSEPGIFREPLPAIHRETREEPTRTRCRLRREWGQVLGDDRPSLPLPGDAVAVLATSA